MSDIFLWGHLKLGVGRMQPEKFLSYLMFLQKINKYIFMITCRGKAYLSTSILSGKPSTASRGSQT